MRVAILGIGNILFRDDGLGVIVVNYLKMNYRFEGDITIVDGGTGGIKLLDYFSNKDMVLVVDVIKGKEVGRVYRIEGKELSTTDSSTTSVHNLKIPELLKFASVLGREIKVVIVGAVSQDTETPTIGLSPTLRRVFPKVVECILKELDKSGIRYGKVADISVEEVVAYLTGYKKDGC